MALVFVDHPGSITVGLLDTKGCLYRGSRFPCARSDGSLSGPLVSRIPLNPYHECGEGF
jgi:hypothetical protein